LTEELINIMKSTSNDYKEIYKRFTYSNGLNYLVDILRYYKAENYDNKIDMIISIINLLNRLPITKNLFEVLNLELIFNKLIK